MRLTFVPGSSGTKPLCHNLTAAAVIMLFLRMNVSLNRMAYFHPVRVTGKVVNNLMIFVFSETILRLFITPMAIHTLSARVLYTYWYALLVQSL